MACNKIYDENGRVVAIACSRKSKEVEEWGNMVKELEERERAKEREGKNE